MVWALIAQVAAAAIGGVMASRRAKKQRAANKKQSENYYSDLRKSAIHGGFNPLTALRNGGGAGYSQVASRHPILSTSAADIFGQAAIAGLTSASNYSALDEEKSFLERDIMKSQLQSINQKNDYFTKLSNKPFQTFGTIPTASGSMVSKNSEILNTGLPVKPQMQVPEAVNPFPTSSGIIVNTNYPNTESYEDRYGDILGGIIGGVIVAGGDLYKNISDIPNKIKKTPSTRKKTGTWRDLIPEFSFKWD